jgi:Uma2 family endonuclease
MATSPSPAMKPDVTPAEYLARERAADTKSEYLDGEIFAKAGGTPQHSAIIFNVTVALGPQLRGGPCRGFNSDLRVKVSETGLYTYPDLMVLCGEARFDDEHRDTLLNPTLIVEVLSPTTEAYARGDKFGHYRWLESLQEYLLIAQDRRRLELFSRQPDGRWILSPVSGENAAVELASIGCRLALADVYDRVEFEPALTE